MVGIRVALKKNLRNSFNFKNCTHLIEVIKNNPCHKGKRIYQIMMPIKQLNDENNPGF